MTNINWYDNTQYISKYFTVGEATQWDSRRIPTDPGIQRNIVALAEELDKIREEINSPIYVTSWYRPPDVNAQVGGAKNSQHLYGRAADIHNGASNLAQFQSFLDAHWYGALGYGAHKGFVHCDSRNGKGWRTGGTKGARWNY